MVKVALQPALLPPASPTTGLPPSFPLVSSPWKQFSCRLPLRRRRNPNPPLSFHMVFLLSLFTTSSSLLTHFLLSLFTRSDVYLISSQGALVIGAVVALTGGIIFSNRMSKKSDHTHSQEARRAQRKWVCAPTLVPPPSSCAPATDSQRGASGQHPQSHAQDGSPWPSFMNDSKQGGMFPWV